MTGFIRPQAFQPTCERTNSCFGVAPASHQNVAHVPVLPPADFTADHAAPSSGK